MKLAILGTRGVPPNYGGFETFAAELGTRLVQRGHEVTVYCRCSAAALPPLSDVPEARTARLESGGRAAALQWNGIRRIVLPAIGHKYLETVSHSFLSSLDTLRRDFDVILLCNAANAFVLPLLRAARIPVAINVDGIERRRRKWNILGRAVYAAGEAFSVSFANAVVADAHVIADYYRDQYGIEPVMIPYGADFPLEGDSDVLARLALEPRNYILYVSRFEPENNPLEVVKAYEKLCRPERQSRELGAGRNGRRPTHTAATLESAGDDMPPPLVMIGKSLYSSELVRELASHATDRILFPRAIYGRDYRTLQRNSLLYVQATEVR